MYIKVLKQAFNHVLVFKNVHRVIQFDKKDWSKYIDMNAKLRKEAKYYSEKDFFKLMNILFLEKQ